MRHQETKPKTMKHTLTLFATVLPFLLSAQSISTVGFTFSPALLTVQAGTDITVTIGGQHTMTEVSEATWNANGNTSNGGFNFGPGTNTLNLTIPGTYYYVCSPHANMGMKGRIVVESSTGLAEQTFDRSFTLYPNPASDELVLSTTIAPGAELVLIDMQGREVLRWTVQGNDRINITQLSAGSYTAVLRDAAGTLQASGRIAITR
jgi:plastocyanin